MELRQIAFKYFKEIPIITGTNFLSFYFFSSIFPHGSGYAFNRRENECGSGSTPPVSGICCTRSRYNRESHNNMYKNERLPYLSQVILSPLFMSIVNPASSRASFPSSFSSSSSTSLSAQLSLSVRSPHIWLSSKKA